MRIPIPARSLRTCSSFLPIALLALVPTAALAQTFPAPTPGPNVASYGELDDVAGTWVNLNVPPVRPLCHSADFGVLWALNAHDSTLLRFDNPTALLGCGTVLQPAASYALPWLPVACGLWSDPDDAGDSGRVVVACAGTHALAFVRAAGDAIAELLPLAAEPGDLLIDAVQHRAWVTLPTLDSLAEIDLRAPAVTQTDRKSVV